jgi:hypothetical protein
MNRVGFNASSARSIGPPAIAEPGEGDKRGIYVGCSLIVTVVTPSRKVAVLDWS